MINESSEKIKKNLKKSLKRAEKYLEIVRKIKNRQCTNIEFEFLQANGKILQDEMDKFNYGRIHFRRPFGLGTFPNLPAIANFPVFLKTRGSSDEGFALIPAIKQNLLG